MNLKHYPGNKSIHGLYQFIINRIPPHTEYYELFCGSAVIADKLPDTAKKTLVDLNPEVIAAIQKQNRSATVVYACDTLQFLSTVWSRGAATVTNNCTPGIPRTVQSLPTVHSGRFIYADPPYRFLNRRQKTKQYSQKYHPAMVFPEKKKRKYGNE